MDTSPSPARAQSATQPQLRTVLLCDLVDSTAMVERLGDARSTELIRRHDRLVRQLLAEHGGRGIDKSDGFLALFDRPIQAVGFAIAYQRELRTLGNAEGVPLSARTGIHVGDVLLWDNTPEDVAAGAKPVEVEGLAKPVAARLMNLALPGQILLSGVAQSLSQRAQSELGPVAARLRWQTHGRFHFRGVPAPTLVHEVGEAGIAPLRVPASTPKAWRDVPVWRRPLTLAVEALAVAVLTGAAVLFSFRADPAIAFRERDWVVVGELNNLTGDARFDGALEVALRTSLEQSRHINLLPEVRVRDTLRRMDRAGDSTIDRATAAEVALREGARAVLMPTVAEVGGRLRFSVEVIDPANQTTVYAESAESAVTDGPLESVADVAASVRERLGESLASVGESSAPLAQVTTPSLDALRAYSLSQEAFARGQLGEAEALLRRALELDPGFALAHAGLGRAMLARGDSAGAIEAIERALVDPGRLGERERLSQTALLAWMRHEPGFEDRWRALAALYPDFYQASHNVAMQAYAGNRFAEMLDYGGRASAPQSVTRPVSVYVGAIALAASERLPEALDAFREARSLGMSGFDFQHASALAAAGRHDEGLAQMAATPASGALQQVQRSITAVAIAVDRGRWDEAESASARMVAEHGDQPLVGIFARVAALAANRDADGAAGRAASVRVLVDDAARRLPTLRGAEREYVAQAVAYAAYVAARDGDDALAAEAIALVESLAASSPLRQLPNLVAIAEARRAMARGELDAARRALAPYLGDEAVFLTRALAAELEAMQGETASALAAFEAIADARGRAFMEPTINGGLQVEHVVQLHRARLRVAELALATGRQQRAADALASFKRAWAPSGMPEDLRQRVLAVERGLASGPVSAALP